MCELPIRDEGKFNLDLRQWLAERQAAQDLRAITKAHWDHELFCVTKLHRDDKGKLPALMFDEIEGYPRGFRVLTRCLDTKQRTAAALGLNPAMGDLELLRLTREKLREWEASMVNFPPHRVESGLVCQNVMEDNAVNLWSFPVPKWNGHDGGRYIGTSDAVITMDPDTGETNLGTYRIQVHDEKTLGLYISPGKHGRIHYEKYHEQGKACPVAISVGHHPLIFGASRLPVPTGKEYHLMGAISGESVEVIKEEITGLPIPANAEIVIVGWCHPEEKRVEGPFGEWTGYYASSSRPAPVVKVERIYYRNQPILLGRSAGTDYFGRLMDSAMIFNELIQNGVPDVQGVWLSEAASQLFLAVSVKQRFAGHAKRAALLTSQCRRGGYFGRYVIVVDEDVDPTNLNQVIAAMCFRSDPEKDIDILRRTWSTPLDPIIQKPTKAHYASRAVIDACRPFEWKEEFPEVIKLDREVVAGIRRKWPEVAFADSE